MPTEYDANQTGEHAGVTEQGAENEAGPSNETLADPQQQHHPNENAQQQDDDAASALHNMQHSETGVDYWDHYHIGEAAAAASVEHVENHVEGGQSYYAEERQTAGGGEIVVPAQPPAKRRKLNMHDVKWKKHVEGTFFLDLDFAISVAALIRQLLFSWIRIESI